MKTSTSLPAFFAVTLMASCGTGSASKGPDAGGNGSDGALNGDGGPDGGGSCTTVSPCGGDVVGTWTATPSCVTLTGADSACAGTTGVTTLTVTSGTATYNADLTYTLTSTGSFSTHVHYPSPCYQGLTCDQIGQGIMQSQMLPTVACAVSSAGACDCTGTAPRLSNETGTYTTSGGTMTLTHAGTTSTNSYCVNGNRMFQMLAIPAGTAAGSFVLTRQ
jgi:hypothetical protein